MEPEENEYEDHVPQRSPAPAGVKSTAIVKYSAVQSPAPFYELDNINLNFPPENWLRESCHVLPHPTANQPMLASLHMATRFHDCVGEVDVMSNAENIKKLLKMPYSKSQVSMMVHRIGKTLFLDEFDINTYLLQAVKKEWDWLRKFYVEHVLQSLELHQKEKNLVRKNRSRDYLQHKNMLSKFLYYSVANRQTAEDQEDVANRSSYEPKPPEARRANPANQKDEDMFHSFQRNVLWTFDDITMLIGTDLPIFGAGSHPCVSLRLRDITKPINILTGLDYWLDNLMCNVPEVMMCYHLEGIVQKYELIKTEDIPQQENCNFSPKVIKDVAQNVLSFLKSNATKAGHTYWLFKDKDGEVVKLYDLTVLCPEGMDDEETNPVTMPLAMLLYRLAGNMKTAGPKRSQLGTIAMLLQNCLALLDAKKHPQIVTSTHYLLSDIYVPDTVDLSSLTLPVGGGESEDDEEDEHFEDDHDDDDDDDANDDGHGGDVASSVEIKTLCLPDCRFESRRTTTFDTNINANCRLSGALAERCRAALNHSQDGLSCLEMASDEHQETTSSVDAASVPVGEHSSPKEEVQARAKPFDPIPLHYEPIKKPADMRLASNAPVRNMSWKSVYTKLLLKKAAVASYVLAHSLSGSCSVGTALRYMELSFLCYDALVSLTCVDSQTRQFALESHLLGLAGDLRFQLVQQTHDARTCEFKEQYDQFDSFDRLAQTAQKLLNKECRYKWAVGFCTKIEENLRSSVDCYEAALKSVPRDHVKDDHQITIEKRLGNVKNEIGVFYMNQAYALCESGELSPEVEELCRKSFQCLDSGVKIFERLDDEVNATLLYSNLGRLMRTRAACYMPTKDGAKEFTSKERNFYDKAISYYQKSLRILGNWKQHSHIRESVSWELSTTYFSMATLLQDYPPLSTKTSEEVEKEITELMVKALKCVDLDAPSAKQPIYQFRAAVIHHRLGALYHHSYRHSSCDDGRKKQLRTLADISLSKSTALFQLLDDVSEFLTVQLERIGMWEFYVQGLTANASKVKCFQKLLELVFETVPILKILTQNPEHHGNQSSKVVAGSANQLPATKENANSDGEETYAELLTLLQKRLQFALLNLAKSFSIKSPSKKSSSSPQAVTNQALQIYKRMYNIALQLPTPSQVGSLLSAIAEITNLYKGL